ncbi:MAG: YfhO family protein [Candidatus Omnitrophica bacterium]|nr:YfhO family protein [Candidatus Omnitrophota bacterium]
MNHKKSIKILVPILLALAFGLWVYVFRGFLLGQKPLSADGESYLYWGKFYFDNMIKGVYPLWYPFSEWGKSIEYILRFLGDLNPFLVIPFSLYKMGLPYAPVYLAYAAAYYFLGILGFFFLAQKYFKNFCWSLLSTLLLLFSSLGLNVFFNYCEIVLFVPTVWFFYFLYSFCEDFKKENFLGIVFCLMIVSITYIPFYFLATFLTFLFFFSILYTHQLKELSLKFVQFFKSHKALSLVSLVALFLSMVPGLIWVIEGACKEIICTYRQTGTAFAHAGAVGLRPINIGGIVGPITIERLFSGLNLRVNQLSYFFFSVFIYLILLISLWNRTHKRAVLFLSICLVMFLIAITDVVGLHQFLYEHLIIFKFMRNIYYLLSLSLPFLALFMAEAVKDFFDAVPESAQGKFKLSVFVVFVHAGFAGILYHLGGILPTSYITILLSGIFFLFSIWNLKFKSSMLFPMILFILAILQPLEVFFYYSKNTPKSGFQGYSNKHVQIMAFSYRRPKIGETLHQPPNTFPENDGFGSGDGKFLGAIWTKTLRDQVDHAILGEYVQYKFILYDHVETIKDQTIHWNKVSENFQKNTDRAFVSEKITGNLAQLKGDIKPGESPIVIKQNGENFQVLNFDVNSITVRTRFNKPKFLVYNDSYLKQWEAKVNGKPVKLYRANVAFKGVYLPAGEQVVRIQYKPTWLHYFYWFLMAFVALFFIYFLIILLKSLMTPRHD